jgi:hypothetical protein
MISVGVKVLVGGMDGVSVEIRIETTVDEIGPAVHISGEVALQADRESVITVEARKIRRKL